METTDVVVIGAGIIGCSIARELAKADQSVVLLERAGIASAASGRNHGLIMYPQNEVSGDLYSRSFEIYRELVAGSAVDVEMDDEPRGFLIVVEEDSSWAAAEREARATEIGGIKVEKVEPDELYRLEPNLRKGLLGGWRMEDGYRTDPAALTLATAIDAVESGADVRTHVDVKSVLNDGSRVRGVATDAGVIQSPVVVNAAGPWAPKLARSVGFEVPIVGGRGWLILTRSTEDVAHHLIESPGWHLMGGESGPPPVTVGAYGDGSGPRPADRGVLIQQNPGGSVLIGGSRKTSIMDDPEDPEITKEIASDAAALLPALSRLQLVSAWSGVRPMTPDGLPLIGWMEGLEGYFLAGGHGGQGIILGAGTGKLVAQMITQQEPFCDPAPFSPGRF
jgi:sarcosine oxidase subunit beta